MKNASGIERVLRILIGAAILGWGAYSWQTTGVFNFWYLIGAVPLFTGLVGWCPTYSLLGINTCSAKTEK